MKTPKHRPLEQEIIYDWNVVQPRPRPAHAFDLFDETLRDGLQSPSVTDPALEDKLEILELMHALGIRSADVGLPGAGQRAFDDVVAMCRYIQKRKLKVSPGAAARTVLADIKPVAEAQQRSGQKLVLYTFIGSSPIRQFAEDWDVDFIVRTSVEAIDFAVKEGLEVAYVTEDTARSSPATLDPIFRAAVEHGAARLVLCDTVGHATPEGARALVGWARGLMAGIGAGDVKLEWHGHNDRGLAVPNAIAALEAGAVRIHGCGLGVGERVGNTSMDQLLLNLKLMGWFDHDLSKLVPYVQKVSQACRIPVPVNYPLSGSDAFRTATGVHAAAIIKAQKRGDEWLADRVYSGVPAGEFGKHQQIEIGHMSGMSNVKYWLEKRGIPCDESLCQDILKRAKTCSWTLKDEEILEVVASHGLPARGAMLKGKRLSS
ncbi:MAG TPA: LeuA family protein [Myxococcaceae bacterium]|nr:LeuA family protein [Myxococcaceae bacterium]